MENLAEIFVDDDMKMNHDEKPQVPSSSSKGNAGSSQISTHERSVVPTDMNETMYFHPGDPDNPLNWSKTRKWTIVATISSLEFVAVLATSICTPAAPQILHSLHSNNGTLITILVSIWELGEAFAPIFIAPLSELYGRLPIYHVANILFVIFSIASAVSSNIGMLIAFRFLNGSTTAALSLNTSVVSDMFAPHERGSAMAVAYFPLIAGVMVAPIIGSYLSQAAGWRWVFWLSAIAGGVCEILFVLFFRESYKVKILTKRVSRIKGDEEVAKNGLTSTSTETHRKARIDAFQRAIVQPAKLALFTPIVPLLAIYNGLNYGYSYLILTTMTQLFETTYGIKEGPIGLMFLGKGTAGIFALIFLGLWDKYMTKQMNSPTGIKPKHRIPPMIVGGVIAPASLFLYGWTVEKRIHWIAPVIATGMLAFSVVIIALSAYGYIADAFPKQVASAMTSTIIAQSVIGALMPLAGPSLNVHLGVGWGSSLLGFIALATLPIPIFIMSDYGEWLQQRTSI